MRCKLCRRLVALHGTSHAASPSPRSPLDRGGTRSRPQSILHTWKEHQMHDKDMVVATFRDRESAERAIRAASERGYRESDIHVMMSDDTRKRHFSDEKIGNKALEGTGVGAMTGGAVGATILGIIAAGTSVAVPGLGLLI